MSMPSERSVLSYSNILYKCNLLNEFADKICYNKSYK